MIASNVEQTLDSLK